MMTTNNVENIKEIEKMEDDSMKKTSKVVNEGIKEISRKEDIIMKKNITMCISRKTAESRFGNKVWRISGKYAKEMEVDLSRLSPAARVIAENIHTTDNRDDLSTIVVEGMSIKEHLEKEGKLDLLEKYAVFYEIEEMEEPVSSWWNFDFLRANETPEEYFERQAKMMKEYGWLRISRSYWDDIDFVL